MVGVHSSNIDSPGICEAQALHPAQDPPCKGAQQRHPLAGHVRRARPVLSVLLWYHMSSSPAPEEVECHYNPHCTCEETEAQGHTVNGSGRLQSQVWRIRSHTPRPSTTLPASWGSAPLLSPHSAGSLPQRSSLRLRLRGLKCHSL